MDINNAVTPFRNYEFIENDLENKAYSFILLFENASFGNYLPIYDRNYIFSALEQFNFCNEFSPNQIKKIMQAYSRMYLSLIDLEFKNSCLENFKMNLERENLASRLKIAKKTDNQDYIKECLYKLEELSGMILEEKERGLTIHICDLENPEYLNWIDPLMGVYKEDLFINLNPISNSFLQNSKDFIELHGKKIHSLDLRNCSDVNDDFIKNALSNCPNLYYLYIQSNNVLGDSLHFENQTLLKQLHLINCKHLKFISNLKVLKNLNELHIVRCFDLQILANLDGLANLTTLNLSDCWDLNELLGLNGLINLKTVNLTRCWGLTSIPDMPDSIHLSSLNLFNCTLLKKIPDLKYHQLKEINLVKCQNLTVENRLDALSSLIDHDMEKGLEIAPSMGIGFEENFKSFILSKIDQELFSSNNPETLLFLSHYVLRNQKFLSLTLMHPLTQEAISIEASSRIEGGKNPFTLFKNLKKLFYTGLAFETSRTDFEGVPVFININALKALGKNSKIKREELPKNATLDAWNSLINELKDKIENNITNAKLALEELGTTWEAIEYSLFLNPDKYLSNLLKLDSRIVSDVEACWRAVLSNIISLNQTQINSAFFTIQEETLIKIIMGLQNCPTEQHVNILSSYSALEPKYKYNLKIGSPSSILEFHSQEKISKAITFLKEFIEKQPSQDIKSMAIDLVKHVNGNLRENSVLINGLLMDTKFWDTDEVDILLLNETGALELLNIAKLDSAKSFCLQFVVQFVKKIVESQFSSESALMYDLCELSNIEAIPQGSHQALYLRNLIGHLVGISNEVVFDKNSGVLNSALIQKSRREVLKVFFKHVTPKILVDKLAQAINSESKETREFFANFLVADLYFQDRQNFKISEYGSLVLLILFGFLN